MDLEIGGRGVVWSSTPLKGREAEEWGGEITALVESEREICN
jgi:hypothetical protein